MKKARLSVSLIGANWHQIKRELVAMGVATYARAKGYPAILGICLALLLNILALLVLLVIPDKTKSPTTM